MTNLSNNNQAYKQLQEIQSYHEPALAVFNEVIESKRQNLRSKNYDVNNAAASKYEIAEIYARYFRVTQYMGMEIINSLIRAGKVEGFSGYVKAKAGEV